MKKKVTIVYYAFINPKALWLDIISGQLTQLKETGITEIANMYVHVSGEQNNIDKAIEKIREILPDSIIYDSTINQYEYRGIHLVWSLARKNPGHIYLYFHTKGMSYSTNGRTIQDKQLFKSVIEPWNKILDIFQNDDNINKIGLGAGKEGWMWFNFWWVRGAYLVECQEPAINADRGYYEGWLRRKSEGFKKSNTEECYSLIGEKAGIYYADYEASEKLNLIPI